MFSPEDSFIVNDAYKDFVFQMIGKYWRQYKHDITRQIQQVSNLPNRARALKLLKPANINSENEWDIFVKERLTADFKAQSERFREMRKKQKYTHSMSRKGFARLESEMKASHPNPSEITRVDIWTKGYQKKNGEPVNKDAAKIMEQIKICQESHDNPPVKDSIRDDALARVLGPEARGRVRGLGFGATPSKVGATIQSNLRFKELEAKMEARMGAYEAKFEELLTRLAKQNPTNSIGEMIGSHASTPQSDKESNHKPNHSVDYQNAKCQLLHWYNFDVEQVVAEGRISSIDPCTKVHHVPLGRDCWKVWVEVVLNENLSLFRSTEEFKRLGEALGSTIAWPKSYIKLV